MIEINQNRRQFLRTVGRGLLLGGLGALAAVLGRRSLDEGAIACTGQGQCAGCGELTLCGLPLARDHRAARGGNAP